MRLLVAGAGGGARPAVTFVGDGQQSICPAVSRSPFWGSRSAAGAARSRPTGPTRTPSGSPRQHSSPASNSTTSKRARRATARAAAASAQRRHPAARPSPRHFNQAGSGWAALVAGDLAAGADSGGCAVLTPTNAPAAGREDALARIGGAGRRLAAVAAALAGDPQAEYPEPNRRGPGHIDTERPLFRGSVGAIQRRLIGRGHGRPPR